MSNIGLCEVVELACRAKSCKPDRPKSLAPDLKTWFISSLFIIRVPFFLLFGFSKGALKKKGKRVPLRDLETAQHLPQAIALKSQVQKLLPFLLFLAFCCRVLRAWP